MKNKLPRFRTADEEARFWDTHDVTDYLEHLEENKEVDKLFVLSPSLARKIQARAKKRLISLRLSVWEIEQSKEAAKKMNVPYQTLMRQWIDEGLRKAHLSVA